MHVLALSGGTPAATRVIDWLSERSQTERVAVWRAVYHLGLCGPVTLAVRDAGGERRVTLARPPIWSSEAGAADLWAGGTWA